MILVLFLRNKPSCDELRISPWRRVARMLLVLRLVGRSLTTHRLVTGEQPVQQNASLLHMLHAAQDMPVPHTAGSSQASTGGYIPR